MPTCVAYGCKNRTGNRKVMAHITFHRFPKDEIRKQSWIRAVRRKNWSPHHASVLCSDHFLSSDIFKTLSKTRLSDTAVPCIFPGFPPHLQKVHKSRKLPKNRESTSTEVERTNTFTMASTSSADTSVNQCHSSVDIIESSCGIEIIKMESNDEPELTSPGEDFGDGNELPQIQKINQPHLSNSSSSTRKNIGTQCNMTIPTKLSLEKMTAKLLNERKKVKTLQKFKERSQKTILRLKNTVRDLRNRLNLPKEEHKHRLVGDLNICLECDIQFRKAVTKKDQKAVTKKNQKTVTKNDQRDVTEKDQQAETKEGQEVETKTDQQAETKEDQEAETKKDQEAGTQKDQQVETQKDQQAETQKDQKPGTESSDQQAMEA